MENKERYFCVGDIHGDLSKLNKVIKEKPLNKNEKYIFVGDYIDRGRDSLGVIRVLMGLVEDNKAYCLLGNHDEMFYKVIYEVSYNKPNLFLYYDFIVNYQLETFDSFLKGSQYSNYVDRLKWAYNNNEFNMFSEDLYKVCRYIKDNFVNELGFIKGCNIYIELENSVISHSGGNKKVSVGNVTEDEWLWSRDFSQPINNKRYIYGHTPTGLDIPLIEGNNINIDNGAIFYDKELVVYTLEDKIIHRQDSSLNLK